MPIVLQTKLVDLESSIAAGVQPTEAEVADLERLSRILDVQNKVTVPGRGVRRFIIPAALSLLVISIIGAYIQVPDVATEAQIQTQSVTFNSPGLVNLSKQLGPVEADIIGYKSALIQDYSNFSIFGPEPPFKRVPDYTDMHLTADSLSIVGGIRGPVTVTASFAFDRKSVWIEITSLEEPRAVFDFGNSSAKTYPVLSDDNSPERIVEYKGSLRLSADVDNRERKLVVELKIPEAAPRKTPWPLFDRVPVSLLSFDESKGNSRLEGGTISIGDAETKKYTLQGGSHLTIGSETGNVESIVLDGRSFRVTYLGHATKIVEGVGERERSLKPSLLEDLKSKQSIALLIALFTSGLSLLLSILGLWGKSA